MIGVVPLYRVAQLLRGTVHSRTWKLTMVLMALLILSYLGFLVSPPEYPNPIHNWMGRFLFLGGGVSILLFAYLSLSTVSALLHTDELRQESRTDALTGLTNRRGIDEALDHLVARAQLTERPLVALMADIDHFKSVNDTYGHAIGDLAIQATGNILGQSMRSGDLVGRYGGEEFVVLMPDCEFDDAVFIAEQFRAALESMPVTSPEGRLSITASVGAAELSKGEVGRDLLHRADLCLYQAKNDGRNRVCGQDQLDAA
ncbi:MAG: GGDEF domain-containing protein [Pseudomonadota bacterium]